MKLTFLLISLLLKTTLSTRVYITSQRQCNTTCSGNSSNPQDSIVSALSTPGYDRLELIMLKPTPGNDHFWLNQEHTGLFVDYNFPSKTEINRDVTIRPLYCDSDPESTVDPNLNGKCLNRGEQIMIYTKNEDYYVVSRNNMTIENIIFDGSEDIAKYNSGSE